MSEIDGAVNMGSGRVYSIRNVVDMLSELTGMSGRIEWDHSKPNGQAYRAYDLSKIKGLGFICDLRQGNRQIGRSGGRLRRGHLHSRRRRGGRLGEAWQR